MDTIALCTGYGVLIGLGLLSLRILGEVLWGLIVAIDLAAFFIKRGLRRDYRFTGIDAHQWIWWFLGKWRSCIGYRQGEFTVQSATGHVWSGFRRWH